jgi:hypothetical protein
VAGTPEAIRSELEEALTKIKGEFGDKLRAKAIELRETVIDDMSSGGGSWEQMMAIGKLGDE